jgi:hypothetical protein
MAQMSKAQQGEGEEEKDTQRRHSLVGGMPMNWALSSQ